METRKIQVVGNRSFAISLPKPWVIANNLKNHDLVYLQTTEQNDILIRKSPEKNKQLKNITLEVNKTNTAGEFLVFCYIRNIDNVRFHAKQLDIETIKAIRAALRYLEGYEIINESEKEIEISFLFNDVSTTIPKLIKRIFYLLKIQVESLKTKDLETLEETEMAIDRLYYLSTRILFSCIHDYKAREQNEIRHDEDVFFLNSITKRMENIADNVMKLKNKHVSQSDVAHLFSLMKFLECTIGQKTDISELKNMFASFDLKSNDQSIQTVLNRILDLSKDVLDAKISMEFNKQIIEQGKISQ